MLDLLKSVLVVPLVAGIVVASAWGLVRCAEFRQLKLAAQEPQPQETTKEGPIALKLWAAATQGDLRVHGGPKPALSNWTRLDESVAWRFRVEKPGRYDIALELACASEDAGSQVRVEAAGTTLNATIPSTGGKSEFRTIRVGQVDFPASGWHVLRIVPTTIAGHSVMVLGGVSLTPVKP